MEASKIDWEEFEHIHVIKKFRQILNSWWNIDLFFSNENGEIVDFSSQKQLFKNLFLEDFLSNKDIKNELSSLLRSSFIETRSSASPYSIKEWTSLGGVYLAILPIRIEEELMGAVIGFGFLKSSQEREKVKIKEKWKNFLPSHHSVEEAVESIKILDNQNLERCLKLLKLTSQEIISFYKDVLERRNQIKELNKDSGSLYKYDSMIGQSESMKNLYSLLDKIKSTDSTVLIQGDNGTGKELIAKSIHYNSSRKNKAFVIQNCSAFNDNLLESELFGHLKGSFTGAIRDKKGLFEKADKGTFFLDEIGDTSPIMQVKLLRVLQEGTFIPVGGLEPKKVNIRVIAATNKDLGKMVEDNLFREDLYYRLNVINIQVPPLRERREDIPLFVEYFLNKNEKKESMKILTKNAIKKLYNYSWPGNVRELQNEMERLIVLSGREKKITEFMLSKKILDSSHSNKRTDSSQPKWNLKEAIEILEKNMILDGLRRTGWNKSKLAKDLGISRASLIIKVEKYNLRTKKMA